MDRMLALLIPSATAQSGLAPVPNASVLVFRINDNGTPNGGVVAQTTTNASGGYTLNLPAGTALGSTLIVQVGPNTPQPVGGTNQLNCPATQPTLNVSPVAEYVTRLLIGAATNLTNFTNAEVNALIARAAALAQDPSLVGANLADTLANIAAAADPEVQQLIANATTPGEAQAPAGLGGSYNLVAFTSDVNGAGGDLEQELGDATINVSAKTFSVASNVKDASLIGSCTADPQSPCATTFTRTSSSRPDSTTGSFTLFGGNQIAFQPSDGDGAVGSYNAAGNLIVIPTGDGLILLIKKSTSAPALFPAYQAGELSQTLASTFTVASGTPYNLGNASTSLTTVSVSGGSLSGSSTKYKMTKEITCNTTQQSGCAQTELLTASTQPDSFASNASTSSTGVLTISAPGQTGASGAISSDGNLFALSDGDPVTDGDGGMVIALRQGSNMTPASLNGTYNFSSLEFGLSSNSRSVASQSGTITLNSGAISGNLATLQLSANSSCGSSGLCPNTSNSQSSKTEDPTGATYTVSPSGTVTVAADPGTTISGYASADGKIIVLTEVQDGTIGSPTNGDSFRGLIVLIR